MSSEEMKTLIKKQMKTVEFIKIFGENSQKGDQDKLIHSTLSAYLA
jgi:hypothetical protein